MCCCLPLSVVAERRNITDDVFDHISKFLPVMRQHELGMARAADYLESWLSGTLRKEPLFSLRGSLAFKYQLEREKNGWFELSGGIVCVLFDACLSFVRCQFGEFLRRPFPGLVSTPTSFFVRPNRLKQLGQ